MGKLFPPEQNGKKEKCYAIEQKQNGSFPINFSCQAGRKLMIIAEDVEGEALTTLVRL